MVSEVRVASVPSSIKTMLGMATDPLRTMRTLGLAMPTANLFTIGPERHRSLRILYVAGGENVCPVFTDLQTFHTSNPPMRYPGGGAPARLRRGLIGNQGAEHTHYRGAFTAQTGREMMGDFARSIAAHADRVVNALPDDRTVDLVELLNDLVRHYAVVTMFKDDNADFALAVGRDITAYIDLAYQAGNILAPVSIPGLPHARFRRSAAELEAKLLAWADQRRGMDAKRDLLSMFVNGPDENGHRLSDDRLVGHIMTLYASSFSSSVAGLLWSVVMLMQHPGIAHDLCDEIESSDIDLSLTAMKLLELPLLDRVIKESMRLFTPVPYQVRRVTRDIEFGDVALKSSNKILIGAWATNRLASTYSDAAAFQPDRWQHNDPGKFDYLVFSAGPRRCVGYGLAMIILKVTLATILIKRRPRLVDGVRIDTRVAITLRSRQPIPVVMQNRKARMQRAVIRGTASSLFVTSGSS